MRLHHPSREFDDAVAAVCHGSASDAEMRALNELLRSNADARDEYLLRIELHTRLASEPDLFALSPVAADVRRLRLSLPEEDQSLPRNGRDGFHSVPKPEGKDGDAVERVPTSAFLGPMQPLAAAPTLLKSAATNSSRPVLRSTSARLLALAACLVLSALGGWNWWFRQPAPRTGSTSAAVAMLTRTVDPRWGRDSMSLRTGDALEPGWLRLESGLAQVVFYSGARVVIEGPAELQLISPSEALCPVGRLLAEVPQPARGFRLKTGQLSVVDLGTAFGIAATRGRTEVHVFKGKVELLSGAAATQTLDEGQAAAMEGNATPQLMAASATPFDSLFDFQQRSLASEAFRYEQWQFASAQLNQDPSLVVRLDFDHFNGADWTLRNTAERNQTVPEATIVGCQAASGRWREKPALEFQSINDRVRLTVPGEFEALTLSAWVCVKGLDRQFNSLFMCDGFEAGTIHWLVRNDGVLGLTVFGSGAGEFQILPSAPVVTIDKFGMWLHLAVVLDGQNRQVVHYVNGVPVSRLTLRLAPPFRIGSAELGNWNARSGSDPAPNLIRNLSGALDEFELFSRALNDAELRDLYAKGKPDA